MPPHNSLPPEIVTVLREVANEWKEQRSERAETNLKLDDLRERTAVQETKIDGLTDIVEKIDKYLFTGNGTPSVLARLTHLEGVLNKVWALTLGLATTLVGGFLAYYLGTK